MASIQIYADSEQAAKVFCGADCKKALGIEGGKAKFLDYNCNDPTQQWLKIQSGDNLVKGFVLVNKVSEDISKAICQPAVAGQEVALVDYTPGSFDNLLLWSESEDKGEGYKCICVANNTTLIWDVGLDNMAIKVVVQVSQPTEYQKWKISPQIMTAFCKADSNKVLSIKDDKLKIVGPDISDATQQWVKILTTDHKAFALVNNVKWMALSNASDVGQEVKLVEYKNILDKGFLWSEGEDKGDGFKTIGVQSMDGRILDSDLNNQSVKIASETSKVMDSQLWKISPQILTACCKASSNKAMSIKNGGLAFDSPNPSAASQQWVKILTADHLAFALVNKGTLMALCNASDVGQKVTLVPYKNVLTKDLLWSESDCGDGYKTIGVESNTSLKFDGDGFKIMKQMSKDSQLWKISSST